ncbi:MAG: 30S ribosomal protein S16 [Planctomycetota bacterium]
MGARIRLQRAGRRHVPFYHIAVYDIRQRRDGASVERIGIYDPARKDAAKQVALDAARAAYWLSVGARPSETVASILRKAGVSLPEKKKAPPRTRKKERPRAPGVKARAKKRTANSKARKDRKKAAE